MPKKPNTPQIITPAPRSLKEAWDKECMRLKYSVGIAYPGDVQKGLIASFLAEPDEAKRDATALKGRSDFLGNWADESAEASVRSLQARSQLARGSDDIDSASRNRIAGKMDLPKRR